MRRRRAPWIAMAATLALMLYPLQAVASPADSVKSYTGLTGAQRADLRAIARDTWNFYSADLDVRQLLLHLQRRQRVVRVRPDRRAAGTACHRATGEQPRRADELRKVLRRPRRDALQRQPG